MCRCHVHTLSPNGQLHVAPSGQPYWWLGDDIIPKIGSELGIAVIRPGNTTAWGGARTIRTAARATDRQLPESTVGEMWHHFPGTTATASRCAKTLTNRHGAGLYVRPDAPINLSVWACQLGAYPRGATHQRAGTEWLSHPQSGITRCWVSAPTPGGSEVLDSGGVRLSCPARPDPAAHRPRQTPTRLRWPDPPSTAGEPRMITLDNLTLFKISTGRARSGPLRGRPSTTCRTSSPASATHR